MRPLLVSPIRGNLLKKIVCTVVVVNPSGILPGRSLTIRQRKELYLHKRQPSPKMSVSDSWGYGDILLERSILCMRREKNEDQIRYTICSNARTGW